MGELTVYFVGVCVHVRNTVPDVQHRVVVINASQPERIHDLDMSPHEARLDIGVLGTPPPDGVRYSIANAVRGVDYDSTFDDCILPLARYTRGEELLLSERAVSGGDKRLASAYFDADGRFFGEVTSGGASVARLVVKTTDDQPVLLISPFDSALPEERIPLPNGSTIAIENMAAPNSTERGEDFLLNYKIFEPIPKIIWLPAEKKPGPPSYRDYTTIGPGCSNTNYP